VDYHLETGYRTEDYDNEDDIDLLFYKGHYMLLKELGYFFRTDSKYSANFVCRNCLNAFRRLETLVKHK
jgi:hypothetical protein